MKKHEVQIGETYVAKVSGILAPVKITGVCPHGGWDAVNVKTGRQVRVKSAMRLRCVLAKTPGPTNGAVIEHYGLSTYAIGQKWIKRSDDDGKSWRFWMTRSAWDNLGRSFAAKEQTTITGRTMGQKSNLQNIPIHTTEGEKIRQALTKGNGQ